VKAEQSDAREHITVRFHSAGGDADPATDNDAKHTIQ
jgi:hypothetical protein